MPKGMEGGSYTRSSRNSVEATQSIYDVMNRAELEEVYKSHVGQKFNPDDLPKGVTDIDAFLRDVAKGSPEAEQARLMHLHAMQDQEGKENNPNRHWQD